MPPSLRVLACGLGLALALPARAGDLLVSAAASLTEAFQELGRRYEARHPGTKVVFNTGASDKLLQQIVAGAPADLFASANQAAMDKAVAQKAVDPATCATFAGNALVLIVPADAKGPASPAALADPGVRRVAVANPWAFHARAAGPGMGWPLLVQRGAQGKLGAVQKP